jgi:Xaa-Pro aminopeptidase
MMRIVDQKLEKVMKRKNLDAILFWGLENIRYLCGFTGSDGVLIYAQGGQIFLSDSRYTQQAQSEVKNSIFHQYKQKIPGIAVALRSIRSRKIGFEANAINFESYRVLKEKLPRVSWVPLSSDLTGLRAVKNPEELDQLKRAVQIASASFEKTLGQIKPGSQERRVAEFLECQFRKQGGDKPAFDTIVASGFRAALPHGSASPKRLQRGETVVIDFGTRFQGYHSDETKTLLMGKPDSKTKKIYEIVHRAQSKAIEAIRPGVNVRRIDTTAREVIHKAGFGKYFGHGTGHGVGLAVHEDPAISPHGKGIVEEGMVFTVEPGIYIPGWGGIRLEDMVRVTVNGCELLTYLPKVLKDNII